MKRKCVGLLVAAALMVQPMTAFAAGSASTAPTPSRDNSSSRTQSMVSGKLDQAQAPAPAASTGAAGGSVAFSMDRAVYESAGLSQDVIEKINTINAGTEPLYRTIGTNNLVGLVPLAPVQAAVVSGNTTVTMYVPNLMAGLNDVQILYYNQTTHAWELMAPSAINYETKEVSVNLSGTTPFTIVYKK